jgi:5-methylthioadenosine/S-adenosylhomocysteine deaminase
MSDRILVKGGIVLSLDRSVGNMTEGDVLIEDGVIRELGGSIRVRNADIVDAADTIVMPGFVDGHHRLWQSLVRNLGSAPTVDVASHFTPDDLYAATLTGLLQAAVAGSTTVVDRCDVSGSTEHIEAALSAHADSGVHTIVVQPTTTPRPPSGATFAAASPDVVAADLEAVASAWIEARSRGERIHARAGTAAASGGEVADLGRRGLLGPDVTLHHCVRLNDADFDAIASSSTGVVLTPSSDMAAGAPPPPVQQFIDRDIRPGLGVGDEMLAPGDVFAQIRSVISVQHATSFDLKLAGKGGVPNLMNTRDVFRYATIDGAKAIGLADVTGSLSPGKRADVIVLRTDRPNITPVNDPIGAVVWGMDTSNVDWVFVGGRTLVEHGEPTADVARVRGLATEAQRRVMAAAGLRVGTGVART